MKKWILAAFLPLCFPALALSGLPPTVTKGANDASNKTTFNFTFPWINLTHTGVGASFTSMTVPLFAQNATPATPAANTNILWFGNDGLLHTIGSTGAVLGYQVSGNYITALTGDVTASGPGSAAATIAANAVTNAKAAQMGAHTYKGNNTGLTANAADVSAANLLTDIGAVPTTTTVNTHALSSNITLAPGDLSCTTGDVVLGVAGVESCVAMSGGATIGTSGVVTLGNPGASTLGGIESVAAVAHNFLTSISTLGVPALAQPAFTDISGSVAATQLPNPTASTLGGIESLASVAHNFLDSISTSGVPHASQPAFTDISGSVAATQLPNPTASTLGGIESLAAVTSKWINTISTSGVPSATQPAFTDISGVATVAQTTIATQAISALAIDWSTGSVFTKTLGANTTFTFSNLTAGQTIVVRLTNTASNYTVTWPTTLPVNVCWAGGATTCTGTQPVETIGAHTDVWTFVYDGTQVYGSVIQNF